LAEWTPGRLRSRKKWTHRRRNCGIAWDDESFIPQFPKRTHLKLANKVRAIVGGIHGIGKKDIKERLLDIADSDAS